MSGIGFVRQMTLFVGNKKNTKQNISRIVKLGMLTHCLRQGFDAEVKFRDFTVHLFTSMEMAEAEWSANSPMDEYWQPDYHKALEGASPRWFKATLCYILERR